MRRTVDDLPARIAGALGGVLLAERTAGVPAGLRGLLATGSELAEADGRVPEGGIPGAGPAIGPPSGLLLTAGLVGLLSPMDRPRLRLAAHRLARGTGADEGTAMTAVAAAVLAADLCRVDAATALVRLRQTLLEEAPSALHARLRPLGWTEAPADTADPGAALQVAITALDRSDDLEGALATALALAGDDEPATAIGLTGLLAGIRAVDADPAAPPDAAVADIAARLAAVASAEPPAAPQLTAGAAAAVIRRLGGEHGGTRA